MSVMDEFVKIAVQDIKGQSSSIVKEGGLNEEKNLEKSDFVKLVVGDVTDKKLSKEELENVFGKSMNEDTEKKSSVELIERFKETAEVEAKATLNKLLRGIK